MLGDDVHLATVEARHWAKDIVAVHEAAATAAYGHIFSEPFPRDDARKRWTRHLGATLLAFRGSRVVGFAAASDDTLEGLYVVPAEAGLGIGSALLAAVGPVSKLWVLEENESGRSFYGRRRWHWSGIRQDAADAGGVQELLYVR